MQTPPYINHRMYYFDYLMIIMHQFIKILNADAAFINLFLYSYVHRVGRTARAGREGYAVTFVTDNDRSLLKAIVSTILSLK